MDQQHWLLAESIYHRLVDLPTDQQHAAARRECADHPELLPEVLSLLDAAHEAPEFLHAPPAELQRILAADAPDPLLGAHVGEYRVESRLGSGGMGVVYLAHQAEPNRPVALKLMRPGLTSASLPRRFEHEAQILARLQHPGIAQIYGFGRLRTPLGVQPYFAMEYVRGLPLLDHVREGSLSRPARLALFIRICDAVQHAHAKGVIHRDLKPSNILITDTQSATGAQPKVLDFGVARVTEPDLQLTTLGTSHGEVVGTLPYMSPEQLRGDPNEIDTRSDVYSLGVILYQLLAGHLPLDLSGKTIAQAAVIVADDEPPRLGSLDRSLRGDAETIAAKALEKDKSRRYQSAAELAEDVRRFLADQPILARPPTAAYQLQKFARRNKGLVAGSTAALVLLVAGVIGTSIGLFRAEAARSDADKRAREASIAARHAERTVDFLTTVLASANPIIARGRDITVRELIDDAAARAAAELAGEPEVETPTRIALARTYLSLNALDAALVQAARARDLALAAYGEHSLEFSNALAAHTAVLLRTNAPQPALDGANQALAIRLALFPPSHALVGRARLLVGKALIAASKYTDAEAQLAQATDILLAADDRELADSVSTYADTMIRALGPSRAPDAQAVLRRSLPVFRARGTPAEPDLATILVSLGTALSRSRQPVEAETALREAIAIRDRIFPPDHPANISPRLRLAEALRQQERLTEARELAESLAERARRVLGPMSSELYNTQVFLARVCDQLHDLDAAALACQEASEIAHRLNDRLQILVSLQMHGDILIRARRLHDAQVPLAEAYNLSKAAPKRSQAFIGLARYYAAALAADGPTDQSISVLREALEIARTAGPEPTADVLGEIADSFDARNLLADAEANYREALDTCLSSDKPAHAASCARKLASFLDRTGRFDEAAELLAMHAN